MVNTDALTEGQKDIVYGISNGALTMTARRNRYGYLPLDRSAALVTTSRSLMATSDRESSARAGAVVLGHHTYNNTTGSGVQDLSSFLSGSVHNGTITNSVTPQMENSRVPIVSKPAPAGKVRDSLSPNPAPHPPEKSRSKSKSRVSYTLPTSINGNANNSNSNNNNNNNNNNNSNNNSNNNNNNNNNNNSNNNNNYNNNYNNNNANINNNNNYNSNNNKTESQTVLLPSTEEEQSIVTMAHMPQHHSNHTLIIPTTASRTIIKERDLEKEREELMGISLNRTETTKKESGNEETSWLNARQKQVSMTLLSNHKKGKDSVAQKDDIIGFGASPRMSMWFSSNGIGNGILSTMQKGKEREETIISTSDNENDESKESKLIEEMLLTTPMNEEHSLFAVDQVQGIPILANPPNTIRSSNTMSGNAIATSKRESHTHTPTNSPNLLLPPLNNNNTNTNTASAPVSLTFTNPGATENKTNGALDNPAYKSRSHKIRYDDLLSAEFMRRTIEYYDVVVCKELDKWNNNADDTILSDDAQEDEQPARNYSFSQATYQQRFWYRETVARLKQLIDEINATL
ncbi:hypothetical protein RFI_07077 [Reticulomyxa filosa]|uniref:Uncharacterized protein n=1 Tax=Reticulomyxa filosa TaxID=46433 RepID=X6NXP1_RETFI|nr:hypothetical protein RFI_07077 [Reticulomyxa filosa]|eukprot:ETO30042.1 hypothetical protein RFI_07077 [Reticulomyxa filosa]